MGTGYNTEVLYKGARYHVQTEDKGLPKAEIVSHIYQGGAILCTKRSSYADIVNDASEMAMIPELTTKQHKEILRIIQQGGLELLKSYIEKEDEHKPGPRVPVKEQLKGQGIRASQAPPVKPQEDKPTLKPAYGTEIPKTVVQTQPSGLPKTETKAPIAVKRGTAKEVKEKEKLALEVLTPSEFYAGQKVGLKVATRTDKSKTPIADAKVVVKILGMSFRPILFSGKADKDGTFFITLTLPVFMVGQASIEISALSEQYGSSDLRFTIINRK